MQSRTLTRVIDFKLPTAILGADVAENGTDLIAACMDGIYRANLETKSHQKIGQHGSYVSSAAFLPAHQAIVTAGYDGVIKWISMQDASIIREQKIHDFWSWDMAVSPDQKWIASVTGQYMAGDYKYTPAPEREPSVRVLDAASGAILHNFSHVPSVQSVTFSHDSKLVAAGNLMGEVRIWNLESGQQVAGFTSKDFTSWGIIKSHCYLGGVFAIQFSADDNAVLICGMGDMRDPMAGNGKQLWQKWDWRQGKMLDQTHDKQSGEGLMEALALHPDGNSFVMAGRLRGGEWNAALFDYASGERLGTIKSGYRITEMAFLNGGQQLLVVGGQGQPQKEKDGKFPDFGRVEVYEISEPKAQ